MNTTTTAEIWKDIRGYEGRYQVSNLGNVKSVAFMQRYLLANKKEAYRLTKPKIIAQQLINSGYLLVHLHKDNKRTARTVHTLVADAFLSGSGEVNHTDGVKTNNCLSNLEYVTSSQNKIHAVSLGLYPTAIKVKATPVGGGGELVFHSLAEAALAMSGRRDGSHLSAVLKGHRRTAYGYKWERVV